MHRTFIALDLPDEVRNALGRVGRQIDDECGEIRWVDEWQLHLTLAFLGDVDSRTLSVVCEASRRAAEVMYPLAVSIPAVGLVPAGRRPRMVWAAVEDYRSDLLSMYEALWAELSELRFVPESRGFRPHVTLGRIKRVRNRERLDKRMRQMAVPNFGPVLIEALGVYTSELHSAGARYTQVAQIRLGS